MTLGILGVMFGLFWLWYREQLMKSAKVADQEKRFQVESATICNESLSWTDSVGGVNELELAPARLTASSGLLLVWWKERRHQTLNDVQVVLDLGKLDEDERKALLDHLSRIRVLV